MEQAIPVKANVSGVVRRGDSRRNRRVYEQRKRDRAKRLAFEALGGFECAGCGSRELELLTIDHRLNNGAEHRRNGFSGYKLHLAILRDPSPRDSYRVLCIACQWRARYGKTLPLEKVSA